MVDRFQRIYSHSSSAGSSCMGRKDPWDPIKLGRAYGNFDAAPQDEKPEMVNPLIESVVARHSKSSAALAPGI
ncbi:hypothetical protein Bca52824_093140 [Brassica carinata]|uniref:Uncharacterized protein n=1 Tax=Brassica carinata TaxID=52824 RepID=A0A8X7P5M6_BRACI|nr:hypothetical protein Bca52824_093140 [Brassica carinata]